MRPSEALFRYRSQIREIALRHRVSSVRVFGSALHGDDTDDSDLDLPELIGLHAHVLEC